MSDRVSMSDAIRLRSFPPSRSALHPGRFASAFCRSTSVLDAVVIHYTRKSIRQDPPAAHRLKRTPFFGTLVTAHLGRCDAAGLAQALHPGNHRPDAQAKLSCHLAAGHPTFLNCCNHPLAKIKRTGSGRRMLASIPSSPERKVPKSYLGDHCGADQFFRPTTLRPGHPFVACAAGR